MFTEEKYARASLDKVGCSCGTPIHKMVCCKIKRDETKQDEARYMCFLVRGKWGCGFRRRRMKPKSRMKPNEAELSIYLSVYLSIYEAEWMKPNSLQGRHPSEKYDVSLLGYTILYYTILYHTILYYTIIYHSILYYTILYYTIPYYNILYYTILYCTIL